MTVYSCVVCFSGREAVVSRGIRGTEGISVDWLSKNLYFTDSGGFIGVVRLQSPQFRDYRRIIVNLGSPRAIVMHPFVG